MSTTVILGRATDDVLRGATLTSDTDPMETYDLATLQSGDPGSRVRFDEGTLILTWTLAAVTRLGVFVLPVSNCDPGTTVATLTSPDGLYLPLTVPERQANGIPRTLAVDLSALAIDTATVRLEIDGNSADVILGGGIFLFCPTRTIAAVQWGLDYEKAKQTNELRNEFGTRYRIHFRTTERLLRFPVSLEPSEMPDVEDWYDADGYDPDDETAPPSLLWVQRDELDPYVGTIMGSLKLRQPKGVLLYEGEILFAELSKGLPV